MQQKKVSRASSTTMIRWGLATAPVSLFKTSGDPDSPDFVKAGPHGKPLERAPVKDGRRLPEGVADRPAAPAADAPLEVTPVLPDDAPEESPVTIGLLEQGEDAELTDADVRRGVRTDDGTFIDLTEKLAEIEEVTQLEEMEVIAFVRRERVPRFRITGSYYLGPDADGGAAKVLRLLIEAMRRTERVAVVKWTKRTRQALGAIVADRTGALIVLELQWAANVRVPNDRVLAPLYAGVRAAEVEAACALATSMADSDSVIDEQEDDRARLERELVRLAQAPDGTAEDLEMPAVPEEAQGSSLEDLLLASAR